MKSVTFITGNQKKADLLAKYLGHPIKHVKLDLDEIQSLDLNEIVEHKVKQAYEIVKEPVLVEDIALEFESLGRLPGPFIKFFLAELSFEDICRLVDGKSRKATARCVTGYYDGTTLKLFEGALKGEVPEQPEEGSGFGWDPIFIPEGYSKVRSVLSEEEYQETYLKIRPVAPLKEFLDTLVEGGDT